MKKYVVFTFLDTDGRTFLRASSKFCLLTLRSATESEENVWPVQSDKYLLVSDSPRHGWRGGALWSAVELAAAVAHAFSTFCPVEVNEPQRPTQDSTDV